MRNMPTYPSWKPLKDIDHIWSQTAISIRNAMCALLHVRPSPARHRSGLSTGLESGYGQSAQGCLIRPPHPVRGGS
jgi:hypothetical protein